MMTQQPGVSPCRTGTTPLQVVAQCDTGLNARCRVTPISETDS